VPHLLILALFASHGLAARPFLRKLRAGRLPDPVDFAVLSVAFYYDIGLLLEAFGYNGESRYLSPLLSADRATLLIAAAYLIAAPWALLAGAALADRGGEVQLEAPVSRLAPGRRVLFYLASAAAVAPLMAVGTRYLLGGDSIWAAREKITADWGPLIVVLYLPLHVLAFYVRQCDSRALRGRAASVGFAAAAVFSTISIGQRTNALLPLLILATFSIRLSLPRASLLAGSLVIVAALLLPMFKWQYTDVGFQPDRLIADTIASDIARGPILAAAIEDSEPIGTRVLPYPMSGYVYSALFFVPRPLAPIKGVSAATHFTAHLAHSNPEETEWILGVGAIEEMVLNLGWLGVVPLLLAYGAALGGLNRLSARVPSLVVPTRLGAFWLCAHHLPAILLIFGTMAVVAWLLQLAFAAPITPQAEPIARPTQEPPRWPRLAP